MAKPGNPTYLPASFKGVPFDAVSSQDDFGRRGDEYEYPLGERTAYKDLGRKIRRYKLEGRITGPDHAAVTAALVAVAESPGPGLLLHPIYGPVQAACVTLTTSFEFHDKKRYTQLQFEFVEAAESLAPFALGGALPALLTVVQAAVSASLASPAAAGWQLSAGRVRGSLAISTGLARLVQPIPDPDDEESFDVVDRLMRGSKSPAAYTTLERTVAPIVDGTATIRVLHEDAPTRLKTFNGIVVETVNSVPEVEPLGVSSRLALAGDYALIAAQKDYPTIVGAITDLDFIVAIYDEEGGIAAAKGDDVLGNAIGAARASAAQTILAANISLPGIATHDARGRWPSFVAAHTVYGDGTRFAELEAYNPTAPTFFLPRHLTGLAR